MVLADSQYEKRQGVQSFEFGVQGFRRGAGGPSGLGIKTPPHYGGMPTTTTKLVKVILSSTKLVKVIPTCF
jgi:hypothetical protein